MENFHSNGGISGQLGLGRMPFQVNFDSSGCISWQFESDRGHIVSKLGLSRVRSFTRQIGLEQKHSLVNWVSIGGICWVICIEAHLLDNRDSGEDIYWLIWITAGAFPGQVGFVRGHFLDIWKFSGGIPWAICIPARAFPGHFGFGRGHFPEKFGFERGHFLCDLDPSRGILLAFWIRMEALPGQFGIDRGPFLVNFNSRGSTSWT